MSGGETSAEGGIVLAASAKELRYRHSVDGNLARELDWAVRERELRHAGEAPRHPSKEAERVYEAPHVRVRERQRVSAFSVLGTAAILGLALMVLLSYVQLTVLSSETVELKTQLETLETDNVILTAQYERMFDLATVRQAAEAAGMTKPSASQICYLDVSGGDTVEIYRQEEDGPLDRLRSFLSHGVYAVVEYFN